MPSWTLLASSDRLQRSSHTVSCVGQHICIFGGEVQPREPIDNDIDLYELSASSGEFKTVSAPQNAPSPRVGAATTVLNKNMYLFSGRGGVAMAPVEENGKLWFYDAQTNTWSSTELSDPSTFPPARSYHTMASNDRDTIYVHAGCPESGRLSDLWAFNVETRAWKELNSAPDPPRGGASLTYVDGKLNRMNGFDGKTEQGGSLDVYDCASNAWSSISFNPNGKEGPEPRSVCTLLAVDLGGEKTLITAFGEHDPSSLGHAGAGKMLGDIWAYSISSGKWRKLNVGGQSPQPRGWFGADVAERNGKRDAIVFHGGLAEDNSRLGDVWLLTLE